MKMIFFVLMQIELIFTTKVLHLASFWKWEFVELGCRMSHEHKLKEQH